MRHKTNLAPSIEDLRRLFEVERYYTELILASPKGSEERRRVLREGYDIVASIHNYLDEKYHRQPEDPYAVSGLFELVAESFRPGRMLEIGCGDGRLSVALATTGCYVVGLDVSELQIEAAQKLSEKRGVQSLCAFVLEDFTSFEDALGFDVILSDQVIEHIHPDEVDDFFSKSFRLLHPGGVLIISTPSRITGPHDVSKFFVPRGTPARGFHLREYSLGDLVALYQRHGFVNLSCPLSHPKVCRMIGYYKWSPLYLRKSLIFEKVFALLPPPLRSDLLVKLFAHVLLCGQRPATGE